MLEQRPPRRISGATLLVFAIAGVAACSGQSCSCIQPLKGGFPIAKRSTGVVQTRLTQRFLSYVSTNAATIVPSLLPTGTTFTIPPSCTGSTQLCCGTPTPTCQLSVQPMSLTLTPTAPDSLHFDTQVQVKTIQNLPVDATILGADAHCVISIDTTLSSPPTVDVSGDIVLPVNATTSLTGLALSSPSIGTIDSADVNLDEAGSDAICGIANVDFIKSFVLSYVSGQVGDLLSTVVQGQGCMACMDIGDCNAFATACTAGKCIGPDGMTCLQELGVEGRANLGAVISEAANAYIDLIEAAGGYAAADTGLSLGVVGGVQSDPHNACVPMSTPPVAMNVMPSVSYQGDVIPGTTTPYDVGIGIHVSHLGELGYSLWDAGGLCLSVGTSTIAELTASTLALIMPSLSDLLHGGNAPVMLQIRPQAAPTFSLGKGTFKMMGTTMVVDDPLITVSAKSFAVDFYVLIDDRYVRVSTLTADLTLPLNLSTNTTGGIVIVAGDLTKALTNATVTNNELLAESAADLAAAFPTLFGAALGPLFTGLGPFQLPELAGLSITPSVFTSTDPDANGHDQFLGIFANVALAQAQSITVTTLGQITGINTPSTQEFSIRHRTTNVPSVTVNVDGLAQGRAVEWSWAIDGGLWRPYQAAGTLTVSDPLLWMQGHHQIQLRARAVGDAHSLDPNPVTLPFIIDSVAPTGDFTTSGQQIVPHATDLVSAPDALRYRVDGGAFVTGDALVLPDGETASAARVEVRDEAGNIGPLPFRGVAAHGCTMARGSDEGSGAFFVLAFVFACAFGRRRFGALLCLGCLSLLGCHHGPSQSDYLDPTDSIGRTHDVVAQKGALHIAAYDETFGDLAYGVVDDNALGKPVSWLLVDGLAPNSAKDGKTPYRHGETAAGPDVGYYASLALTGGGEPRIAYYDATDYAVKFARGGFPFEVHAIETGMSDGSVDIGAFPAITLDPTDLPTVAYMVVGLGNGTSGFRTELHVAKATTLTPSSAGDWTISVVDSAPISCGGRCGAGTACITTAMVGGVANTNPAISSCVATDLAACPTACSSSQACIQKACEDVVSAPPAGDLPAGTGLYAHLVRGPSGQVSLIYYDRTHGELHVATESNNGMFVGAVVDGGLVNGVATDKGQSANGVYDANGVLQLAYRDAIAGILLYRSLDATGVPSPVEVVDDGQRTDGLHEVGASASLLAENGTVFVLYQDQGNADLLLAQRAPAGGWTSTPVLAGAVGAGFSSHLLSDSGTHYYSTWTFDRSMTPLGKLVLDSM